MESFSASHLILLILIAYVPPISTNLIGRIANASLIQTQSIIIDGTCQSCVCRMMNLSNNSVSSLNCFSKIQQCELFLNSSNSMNNLIQRSTDGDFYFRALPFITPAAASTMVTNVSSGTLRYAYWTFDNTFSDLYGIYNGIPFNSTNFSSTVGINGYGRALSVNRPSSQYVQVTSPGFSLINESFTIEAWINPGSGMTTNDFLIFAQCSNSTGAFPNRCLSAILRSGKPMISFNWGGDCTAPNSVTINQWSHLAFVHDFDRRTQSIYTNGLLTCFLNGSSLYIGVSTVPLQFGGSPRLVMFYTGLIDEVSLITRAKSASEILEDATLTFRYTFDAGIESFDSGPMRINGTMINVTSSNNGRFGQAITFNQSTSYFQTSGLVLFGTSTYPYTIAMWIYPYSTTVGTLLMAWSGSWCLPVLGFSSTGILHARHRSSATNISSVNTTTVITLNTWTHVAVSWGSLTGIRLHINGRLVGSSPTATVFNSSGSPMNFGLGGCVNSSLCACSSGSINMGQYLGMVDEFRLYSRVLTLAEIVDLWNG